MRNGTATEFVRDWPGIWLSCAVVAGVAAVAFALFFPKDKPLTQNGRDPTVGPEPQHD